MHGLFLLLQNSQACLSVKVMWHALLTRNISGYLFLLDWVKSWDKVCLEGLKKKNAMTSLEFEHPTTLPGVPICGVASLMIHK
jgi:hypothetical protein